MPKTYVFEFYNLYIPKGMKYLNKGEGIRIEPLKIAEDFEENRKSLSSPYSSGGWHTAKCYIKSDNEDKAREIASWLGLLYTFAQNRSVYFLGCYRYKKGKKYSSFHSKYVESRENRFSELISGKFTVGPCYTRDISLFIDTSIRTLRDSSESKLKDILTTVHAYTISKSQPWIELSFLIAWIALEKLANLYYNNAKSQDDPFTKKEIDEIKKEIEKPFDSIQEKYLKFRYVRDNFTKNYLFYYDTRQKVLRYLHTLDLEFKEDKLKKMIGELVPIRIQLVHKLNSSRFSN